tara:strand:- start:4818 stop:5219 length:402 start_codon:yes stop_codon:yes gene_type:complete
VKYKIIVLVIIFSSCSTPDECPQLNYNSINKLTTLSDGLPFTGRCTVYKDGVKSSIQQYLNGIDYGNWIFYFSNGKIETKGKFRDGKRVGKWRYYYESGRIKQISRYSKLGERDGKWIEYDEDGKKLRTTIYQ